MEFRWNTHLAFGAAVDHNGLVGAAELGLQPQQVPDGPQGHHGAGVVVYVDIPHARMVLQVGLELCAVDKDRVQTVLLCLGGRLGRGSPHSYKANCKHRQYSHHPKFAPHIAAPHFLIIWQKNTCFRLL